MFSIELYDYHLPPGLIAQRPQSRRDESRLLVLDSRRGIRDHKKFRDVVNYLGPDDLLVLNNSKVMPARLFGNRESGGRIEMLLLAPASGDDLSGWPGPRNNGNQSRRWKCLLKSSGKVREGMRLSFGPKLTACVKSAAVDGVFEVELEFEDDLHRVLDEIGHIPLPPYIRREDEPEDRSRYQTVYAEPFGSAASPTAGLHFTEGLLRELQNRGVERTTVTLHVGLGTFRPVKVDDIRHHRMHHEWVEVSEEAAETINRAKGKGKRIVAVGTTSVRVLEFMGSGGRMRSGRESCGLYLYPGCTFSMVGAMITNFHVPRSSLLLLCSAFAGRDNLLPAYREAVQMGYRFLSYGDAMLIL